VRVQLKINEDFGKRIHAIDKLLENMSSKMDNFTVDMQNQLNFNKMLETQIQQISMVLPRPNNRDSTNTPVQESVKSIFVLFQGTVPDSAKKFLREVDKEKSKVMSEVNSKAILSHLWSSLGESKVNRKVQECIVRLGRKYEHHAQDGL
jgi:hypothetical protein